MVLLQSMDKFDEMAELETTTGKLIRYSKQKHQISKAHSPHGFFAVLDGHLLCLYRDNDKLNFRVDNKIFEVADDTTIELSRGKVNVLQVARNGKVIFSFPYRPPIVDPPLTADPTPFVDEEDYDFGLFVHNVVTNDRRRRTIFRE